MKKSLLLWLLLIGVSHGFIPSLYRPRQTSGARDASAKSSASSGTFTSHSLTSSSKGSTAKDVAAAKPLKDSEAPDREQKKEDLIQDTLDELLSVSHAKSNSSEVRVNKGSGKDVDAGKNVTGVSTPSSSSRDSTAGGKDKATTTTTTTTINNNNNNNNNNNTTKKPGLKDAVGNSNSTAAKDTEMANKTLAELVKDALEIARETVTDKTSNSTGHKPVTSVVVSKTKLLGSSKQSTSKSPSETSTKTPASSSSSSLSLSSSKTTTAQSVTSSGNSTSGSTTKRSSAVTTGSRHAVNATTYISGGGFVPNGDDIPVRSKAFADFGAKGPSGSGDMKASKGGEGGGGEKKKGGGKGEGGKKGGGEGEGGKKGGGKGEGGKGEGGKKGGGKGEGGKKGGGGSGGKKKPEAKEIDQTPPAEATQGHLTSHSHGEFFFTPPQSGVLRMQSF